MKTRKSSYKKANCFEALGKAVEESKTTDVIESSSVTMDNETKGSDTEPNLKDSFLVFQNKTEAQFCNIEYSFHRLGDSITALHDSLAELRAHQNKSQQNDSTNSDFSSVGKEDDNTDIDDTNAPTSTYLFVNIFTPKTTGTANNTPTGFTTPFQSGPPIFHVLQNFWKVVQDDNLEPHLSLL